MKPKYTKRYVVGEGRPHFYYNRELVGVGGSNARSFLIGLSVAPELEDDGAPKYRLVLERVDKKK